MELKEITPAWAGTAKTVSSAAAVANLDKILDICAIPDRCVPPWTNFAVQKPHTNQRCNERANSGSIAGGRNIARPNAAAKANRFIW
jgi:hypothetical protein